MSLYICRANALCGLFFTIEYTYAFGGEKRHAVDLKRNVTKREWLSYFEKESVVLESTSLRFGFFLGHPGIGFESLCYYQ